MHHEFPPEVIVWQDVNTPLLLHKVLEGAAHNKVDEHRTQESGRCVCVCVCVCVCMCVCPFHKLFSGWHALAAVTGVKVQAEAAGRWRWHLI